MLAERTVAIVVPAFDEEASIASVIDGVPAFVDRVIVVDDASRDRTVEIAKSSHDRRVVVIEHATNLGVGAAIATGYARAIDEEIDVACVMAGDGQMDPSDLPRLVGPIARGEADYVKGDRAAHPDVAHAMPIARFLATQAFAVLTRLAAGLDRLSDSQCGYTAISRRALLAIDLASMWPRYGYPNDVIGLVAERGLRVAEVPVRPVYLDEASGLRARHAVVVASVCARVALRRVRRANPVGHARPRPDADPFARARRGGDLLLQIEEREGDRADAAARHRVLGADGHPEGVGEEAAQEG